MNIQQPSLGIAGALLLAALTTPILAQSMTPGDSGGVVEALVGSGFTYQGFLTQSGATATGAWDFEFLLFDAAAGGASDGLRLALNVQTDVKSSYLTY